MSGWEPPCLGDQVISQPFGFDGDDLQLHRGQHQAIKVSGPHLGGGLGMLGWLGLWEQAGSKLGASWADPTQSSAFGREQAGTSWLRLGWDFWCSPALGQGASVQCL